MRDLHNGRAPSLTSPELHPAWLATRSKQKLFHFLRNTGRLNRASLLLPISSVSIPSILLFAMAVILQSVNLLRVVTYKSLRHTSQRTNAMPSFQRVRRRRHNRVMQCDCAICKDAVEAPVRAKMHCASEPFSLCLAVLPSTWFISRISLRACARIRSSSVQVGQSRIQPYGLHANARKYRSR